MSSVPYERVCRVVAPNNLSSFMLFEKIYTNEMEAIVIKFGCEKRLYDFFEWKTITHSQRNQINSEKLENRFTVNQKGFQTL